MQLDGRQKGFTLVEVMITVFVVAIGLLSAAALQVVSKKAAFEAVQRSTANALAQDIIERMRGNRNQLAGYVAGGTTVTFDDTTSLNNQDCSTATCTANQLVAQDLYQWWQGLLGSAEKIVEGSGSSASRSNAGGLISPTGCLSRSSNSCRVTVAIAWRGMTLNSQGDSSDTEDPTNNTCGQTRADYEWNATAKQSYRRVLVVEANLGAGNVCP